ncbi:MAG TPA: acyl carrier protein [Steroidobacteraceae bacterium]|nr:acyl carrier protein [Steroidobacteraceae bacterium]
MSTDLIPRINKVFSGVFGRKVPFSAGLDRASEPRWTSLKHVEFIIALEVEFGVRFDGADATDMTSIPIVAERVAQRLA